MSINPAERLCQPDKTLTSCKGLSSSEYHEWACILLFSTRGRRESWAGQSLCLHYFCKGWEEHPLHMSDP